MQHLQKPLRLLCLLWLLGCGLAFSASAQSWAWANSVGAGSGNATAVDSAGNVYVTGSFKGTVTFGSTTLTSVGKKDIFVAKLDPTGTYQWVQHAGGADDDGGTAIAVDRHGDVYVTGYFLDRATFGSTILLGGNVDLFVMRLAPDGSYQWAINVVSQLGNEIGWGIAVDAQGDLRVTGSISGTLNIGGTVVTGEMFVGKLTPGSIWQWAVGVNCTSYSGVAGVVVDRNGDSYFAGYFSDTLQVDNFTFRSAGTSDGFVAKVSPTGSWQWAVVVGSSQIDEIHGIGMDGAGDVYVTGEFMGTVAFDTVSVSSSGSTDVFVAKISQAGNWQWAAQAGGAASDRGSAITVDSSGNSYLTGAIGGSARFGTTNLPGSGSNGDSDLFVAALAADGVWLRAEGVGGSGNDMGQGLALAPNGALLVTGKYNSSSIILGPTRLTNPVVNADAILLARLEQFTVGLAEEGGDFALDIYPNPAHSAVRLQGLPPHVTTIELVDLLGRTVKTWPVKLGASTVELALGSLTPGWYLVRAGQRVRRLVVE